MSPSEINKRIALACRLKYIGSVFRHRTIINDAWEFPDGKIRKSPNYYGDLNAIHEAEKSLSSYEYCERYNHELADVVFRDWKELEEHGSAPSAFCKITATAPQRCEAFLRTINQWETTNHDEI